jgi:hypothetical protein
MMTMPAGAPLTPGLGGSASAGIATSPPWAKAEDARAEEVSTVSPQLQAAAMGPTSTPAATFTPTPRFYTTVLANGLGFCGSVVAGVALFVLLILVRRTLTRVTREAEQNERVADGTVQSALDGR